MKILEAYEKEYNTFLDPINIGKQEGLILDGPVFESIQTSTVNYLGKGKIVLSSNNYLGLTSHPEVIKASKEAIDIYGTGVCGSRMHNGTTKLHKELERDLANFFGSEDAIICNSGYMTNLAILDGFTKDYNSLIITDAANHASINDGIKMSNGKKKIFKHNDMEKLEYILKKNSEVEKKLIVVDGIYSMKGDMAPLDKIVELSKKYNAMVMVDEAHSFGVYGEKGRGLCNYFGVEDDVQIKMITFSKSLGNIGGAVIGSKIMCDYIRFNSSPYLFTVSTAPSSIAGTKKALEIIKREPWRIDKLWENTAYFKEKAKSLGFKVGDTVSPIIPIVIGDKVETLTYTNELLKNGVFACSAVFPVVPKDQNMIRVTISAILEKNEIEKALYIMQSVALEMGILTN